MTLQKLESGEAAVVVLEGTSPGSTVTRLRIACCDDKGNDVEGVSGSIQVSWSKDRTVAQFQDFASMVSLPDLEVRPHHSALLQLPSVVISQSNSSVVIEYTACCTDRNESL